MAEPVPLSPTKDEGSPPPLQSPSNPDIDKPTDNILNNDNNDNNNNDDKDNNNNNNNKDNDDTPNTEIATTDSLSIEDIEAIPNHQRENVISTTKIIPIVDIINEEENNKQNKPKMASNNKNEEKEESNATQQKTKLMEINVEHGHCSKQGIRPSMEDQVVVESSFIIPGTKCTSGYLSLYGVFDGHGGSQCAEFCASNLQQLLKKYLLTSDNVKIAFNLTIAELDTKAIEHAKDASGSTACIILIDNRTHELWCCNVGDSRCILIDEKYEKVKQLSIEHKPDYPLEKQRIESANGWVTFGRVCGILAVSRSLGDKDFKHEIENLIISTPDITHHKLILNEDKYIILACDGLFDVFTNEQCMDWLLKNTTNSHNDIIQDIADKLCHDSIYVRKTKDNVSIIIIRIDHDEIEIDLMENVNDENDFDGQEAMIMDEIKDEKIYNSTSSNGSGQSSLLSPNENINDSLQSHLSNGSNASQGDSTNNNNNKPPTKHKFHVVMASDDGLMDNINENDIDNVNIEQQDIDDVESK